MNKVLSLLCIFLLSAVAISLEVEARPQRNSCETDVPHVSIVDGNRLYEDCLSAEKTITGSGHDLKLHGGSDDLYHGGRCYGYISGILESIPVGENFHPDESVRLSQYVDVVQKCLRNDPARRHLQAYDLVRSCLQDSFRPNR